MNWRLAIGSVLFLSPSPSSPIAYAANERRLDALPSTSPIEEKYDSSRAIAAGSMISGMRQVNARDAPGSEP